MPQLEKPASTSDTFRWKRKRTPAGVTFATAEIMIFFPAAQDVASPFIRASKLTFVTKADRFRRLARGYLLCPPVSKPLGVGNTARREGQTRRRCTSVFRRLKRDAVDESLWRCIRTEIFLA
ncbi:hypothetical protein RHE_PF00119 (plasmid) [Rhizobium etli CFN 42]|uniref:Uncharacterized protein n=1 Tax=Rhizobium etli (strain ATCC 51251 / DSM 11541 / JCM 21823 / NBRC 15573 / CFN 42) TaxID=347834 RepID=Q2JZH4_RHIEC|nr:hypothetical protein RHE_PF00119 [Rhizobium etli CFN 42]